jgi:hypothetical protein
MIPPSQQLLQAIEVITRPALLIGVTFHRVIPLEGVTYAIVWLIPFNGVRRLDHSRLRALHHA